MAAVVGISTLALFAGLEAGPAAADDVIAEDVAETAGSEWGGDTAPDAIAAAALAAIRGVLVEDLSQRTEVSQTFALPDGQWRTDISTGPEWVATGEDPTSDEGWEHADSDLVSNGDGGFEPKAHVAGLQFSGASEGRTEVVAGHDADGEPFSLWWDGGLPEPIVADDAIRYVDVEPGIDLVFKVDATGYEQFFVAKDLQALESVGELAMQFAAPESDLRVAGDGLVVRGDDGDSVAQVSDVSAWDADSDALHVEPVSEMAPDPSAAADPAGTADEAMDLNQLPTVVDVPAEISVASDVAEVSIAADDVPFDEDDAFPVVIDPSANLSISFDTYVSDAWLSDRSGQTELLIGTANSGADKFRSYLNVSISPILGKKVTAATLKLYNHHSWSCTAKGWEVWSTSTTSTATRWTNKPAFGTKYASSTSTKGYSSSCADGYVSADITSMAQAWSTGTATSKGVGIKAASETDNFGWKRFYSGNSSSNKPVISVTYNSYPNTPSSVKVNATAPASGAVLYTKDTTPTFTATVSDPDGNKVKGLFTIKQGSTTVVSNASGTSVASGSTTTYTPAALAQGKAYAVSVAANDGTLTSKSSSSPTWTVYVDTAAPGATAITSSQFTNGQWKDTAPSSVSATLKATDAVKFEYKVDGGAVKTVTASSTSATITGLPRAKGGHRIEARAIDRAANTGAWGEFEYGIGSVGITAPAAGFTTTDKAVVKASAPPGANGDVKRAVYWRPSGKANGSGYSDATGSVSGWTKITDLSTVAAGAAADVNYTWSAASSVPDAYERLPYRMDVQVCFTYVYTADTLCSWTDDADSHTSVVRLPHAFGDGFPVTDAGPGQVALWTGEFNTAVTDVSVPGYTGTLSVSRSYNSFAGGTETSPFGPGWAPSFEGSDAGAAGLAVIDTTGINGMIALEDVDGTYLLYGQPGGTATAQKTGTYVPLDADTASSGWQLSVAGSGTSARLTVVDEAGVSTVWAHRGSGLWQQERVTEPGGASTTFTYSQGKVSRILAPVPDGVTCTTLVAGCRALNISYYATTDAAVGAYAGRVSHITSTAWDPVLEQMTDVPVAQYSYDSSGRLTKVTDPRSGLATSYGYGAATGSGAPTLTSVTPAGLAPWKIAYGKSTRGENSVLQVSRKSADGDGTYIPTTRLVYGLEPPKVPSGSPNVREAAAAWGQSRIPTHGFAVFTQGSDPGGSSVSDVDSNEWRDAAIQFTDSLGYTVNAVSFGAGAWQYTATEYDDEGRIVRVLDEAATAHLMEQSALNDGDPVAEEDVNAVGTVTRYNSDIVAASAITVGSLTIAKGAVILPAGSVVTDEWAPASEDADGQLSRLHTHYIYDQGAPNSGINAATGQRYALVTTTTQSRADATEGAWDTTVPIATAEPTIGQTLTGYNPIDGEPATSATSGWTLGSATSTTTVMGGGQDIVSHTRYDALGRIVEQRQPGSSGTDAATERTIYYTAGTNTEDALCGAKPAWAGQVCATRTAESAPSTPTTRVESYTRDLAPATVSETLGDTTRTTVTTYLADGRTESTSTSATGLEGSSPVAKTWTLYDTATGLATATASASVDGPDVRSGFDAWGRTVSYTDTDGAITTTQYNAAGDVAAVDDGHFVTTYTYDGTDAAGADEHRGLATAMTVTGADGGSYTYTAAYDAAGNLTTQQLPGGLTQTRTYTLDGDPIELAYVATDVDGETVPLVAWSQQTDLFGRVIAESTPNAGIDPAAVSAYNRTYAYDRAGRLTDVTDRSPTLVVDGTTGEETTATPCVSRHYSFDTRGNRLARSTVLSGTDGICADAADGATETWTYDDADRVQTAANAAGDYEYDSFGRQTLIPGADSPAGMNAGDLTIGYYDTDLARSITQAGATTTFELDPLMRRSTSTTSRGEDTSSTVRHYVDDSDAPAWATSTTADGTATMSWYGASLAGDLAVTITDGTPRMQLADLHGDVALPITIGSDNTVAAIGAFTDYDEYGRTTSATVTAETGTLTYGWLGAKERATDTTGLLLMGVRLYNPNTGLFTSVDPIPGGNTTAYAYPQDPINKFDLDGREKRKEFSSAERRAAEKARAGQPLTRAEAAAYRSYKKKAVFNEKISKQRNVAKRQSSYGKSKGRGGSIKSSGLGGALLLLSTVAESRRISTCRSARGHYYSYSSGTCVSTLM